MTDLALEPWTLALDEFPITGTARARLRAALAFAVLAPSGHNTQPWLFRFRGDALELLADRTRTLRRVDPAGRELVMSCGAVLECLTVALRHFSQRPTVELFPDATEPDLLARVSIAGQREPDQRDHALFAAIAERHTNRFPFEPRALPEPVLGRARAAADREGAWLQTLRDVPERGAVADLIARAAEHQMDDAEFRRELSNWVHANRTSRQDGIPGFSYGMGDLTSHLGPVVLRSFDLGRGTAARDRDLARAAPVLGVLWTEGDSARDWLRAGRALAALLLTLQVEGVSASFFNQPIEVGEFRRELARLLRREGFPQLILRLGYGRAVRPTPRRPVHDVLIGEVGEV